MNPDPQLEALIQRELNNLPGISAPATLLPRVLQAIRAQSVRPWWQQSWAAWPAQIQTVSLATLTLVALALSVGGGWAWHGASLSPTANGWREALPALGNTVVNTALSLFRHAGTAWLLAGLTAVTLMYLTCVGVGTLCVRLVISKR